MLNKSRASWLGILLIAALALLVAPVAAQTTPEATAQATLTFPLANPGAYTTGVDIEHFTDASRNGRKLDVEVWYPAIAPANPTTAQRAKKGFLNGWQDAAPDPQAAHSPLILESLGGHNTEIPLLYQLASHGYVVAKIISQPDDDVVNTMVDRPLDILFILNQMIAANQTDFSGIIDPDHVGVIGFSAGAYTSLALTGARINPATAKDYVNNQMWNAGDWDKLAAYRATLLPALTSDPLWPPYSDSRIRAAVLVSACHSPMFGEQGLATDTVPTLIIGGTKDSLCSYPNDDVYQFTHIGSQNKYLVSVIGGDHGAGFFTDAENRVSTQLYAAFFDVYLKGQQDEAQYLTADYVNSVEAQVKLGFVWGVYTGS